VRACSTLAFYARQMAMPGLLGRVAGAAPELDPVLRALAANSRALASLLSTRDAPAPIAVPLEALRGRADRDRGGDEPRDLDLAVLCAERMTAALAEMRAALSG
jgi:hypothetical protein